MSYSKHGIIIVKHTHILLSPFSISLISMCLLDVTIQDLKTMNRLLLKNTNNHPLSLSLPPSPSFSKGLVKPPLSTLVCYLMMSFCRSSFDNHTVEFFEGSFLVMSGRHYLEASMLLCPLQFFQISFQNVTSALDVEIVFYMYPLDQEPHTHIISLHGL